MDSDTLTFSGGLTGGFRNIFEQGDIFEVRQQELTRPTMYIWPIPSDVDETTDVSFSGTTDVSIAIGDLSGVQQEVSQSFTTGNVANVLAAVNVTLGASTGDPRGNLVVRIESDSSGPNGLLAATSKGSLKSAEAGGANRVPLIDPVRLSPLTTYHIRVQIPAQTTYYSTNDHCYTWATDTGNGYANGQSYTFATPTWTAVSANDHFFETLAIDGEEHLIIHYLRYPISLDADTDLFEVGDEAMEAVYLFAEYQAWQAKRTMDNAERAKQKYDIEIVRLKQDMLDKYATPYSGYRQVTGFIRGSHNRHHGYGRIRPYNRSRNPLIRYTGS